MKPIYKPKGRAGEYCEYACNIYDSCNHGCTYCWARDFAKRTGKPWGDQVKPRESILKALRYQLKLDKQLSKGGNIIHLCFTCDPYPADIDTIVTREIIKLIKDSGNHVQILTKGGDRALRDFDLLDSSDRFGITYTGILNGAHCKNCEEPNAASDSERFDSLCKAHSLGIKTWVSLEPVLDQRGIEMCIKHNDFIDEFFIGKMNYRKSDIDWKQFGEKCIKLCREYGRSYYIKDDLQKEMEK